MESQNKELETVKVDIRKGRLRDQFLLKLLSGLEKNGDMGRVSQILKRERLVAELENLK